MHWTPLRLPQLYISFIQSQETSHGRLAAIGSLPCLLAECLCPSRVVPLIVIPIFASSRVLEPLVVGLIPLNRSPNSVLDTHCWAPTSFSLNFGGIQGIASIVTGSFLHGTNQ